MRDRAGDVIPEVVSVVPGKRTGKEKKFRMPASCPRCGSEVEEVGGYVGNFTVKVKNDKGQKYYFEFIHYV